MSFGRDEVLIGHNSSERKLLLTARVKKWLKQSGNAAGAAQLQGQSQDAQAELLKDTPYKWMALLEIVRRRLLQKHWTSSET